MHCKKKLALWDTVKCVKWGLKVATFITLVAILYNFCWTCLLKHAASTLTSALVMFPSVFPLSAADTENSDRRTQKSV